MKSKERKAWWPDVPIPNAVLWMLVVLVCAMLLFGCASTGSINVGGAAAVKPTGTAGIGAGKLEHSARVGTPLEVEVDEIQPDPEPEPEPEGPRIFRWQK